MARATCGCVRSPRCGPCAPNQLRILNDSLGVGGGGRFGQAWGCRHVEKGQGPPQTNKINGKKKTIKTEKSTRRQKTLLGASLFPEAGAPGCPEPPSPQQHGSAGARGPFAASIFTSASPRRKPTTLLQTPALGLKRGEGKKTPTPPNPQTSWIRFHPPGWRGREWGQRSQNPSPFQPPPPLPREHRNGDAPPASATSLPGRGDTEEAARERSGDAGGGLPHPTPAHISPTPPLSDGPRLK